MIDNFDKIRELLYFNSDDDFYFIQVLQRKKDYGHRKVNGSNNSSRLIKGYYVSSLKYFDFVTPEIKALCDVFGARAGINLNKRSFERCAYYHLKKVTDQILNGEYKKQPKAYNSVVGAHSNEKDKRWILDIDDVGRDANEMVLFAERKCEPEGAKYITTIPSRNGYHLIMSPFNVQKFNKQYPDVEVHKNNPTNLYVPF